MAKFQYDRFGNITPYKLLPIQHDELKEEFVIPYKNSTTRLEIINGHSNYIIDFYNTLKKDFIQWLDGSFTTTKTNPNDIDLINYIHFSEELNKEFESLKDFLTPFGDPKSKYKVDGYLEVLYPQNDPRYALTLNRYHYWIETFGKDRQNNPKAILQLEIQNNG